MTDTVKRKSPWASLKRSTQCYRCDAELVDEVVRVRVRGVIVATCRECAESDERVIESRDRGPCEHCGRVVVDTGTATAGIRDRMYVTCSQRCKEIGERARVRLNRPDTAVCAHCGDVFQPARSDARFCCNAHRQAAYRDRKVPQTQACYE
jgi:hypothetical protein